MAMSRSAFTQRWFFKAPVQKVSIRVDGVRMALDGRISAVTDSEIVKLAESQGTDTVRCVFRGQTATEVNANVTTQRTGREIATMLRDRAKLDADTPETEVPAAVKERAAVSVNGNG